MNGIIKSLIGLSLLGFSVSTEAFKLETHMWVGQEVINDLEDDGRLRFDLGKERKFPFGPETDKIIEIEVPLDVKEAILSNKSTYLMGTIGPDAVPDMLAGQMVVHPGGIEDGSKNGSLWYSSQWLEYLLRKTADSDKNKAFAYGYLTHAATDVFSHTYIDQYSGEVFSFENDTIVSEYRHIKLEQFIADRTPPLKDYEGNLLGDYASNVLIDDEYGEFVRDTLIYDDEIQGQYSNILGGKHLSSITELKDSISNMANADILKQLDEEIVKMIANYYGYPITQQQTKDALTLLQKIINISNDDIDQVQEDTDKLYNYLAKIDNQRFGDLAKATAEMQDFETKVLATFQEMRDELDKLKPEPLECPQIPGLIEKCQTDLIGNKICWGEPTMIDDPICNAARDGVLSFNDSITNEATKIEDRALDYKYSFLDRAEKVRQEAQKIGDALVLINKLLIDLAQVLNSNVSPIRSLLINWESDIDDSMSTYGMAMSQTLVNTMKKESLVPEDFEKFSNCGEGELTGVPVEDIVQVMQERGCQMDTDIQDFMADKGVSLYKAVERKKFYEPAQRWLTCNVGQLQGIPSELSNCELKDNFEEILYALDKITELLAPMEILGEKLGLPTRQYLTDLSQSIMQGVQDKVSEEAMNYLQRELGVHFDELVTAKGISDEQLQAVFNETYFGEQSGLLAIPQVAQRVRLEMGIINSDGVNEYFNPEAYTVTRNAVTLSKLALLDEDGIRELIREAGVNLDEETIIEKNVVASFIGSLDGHHQWELDETPQLPALDESNCQADNNPFRSTKKFVLYDNIDVQESVFKKLFVGALAKGLAQTDEIKSEAQSALEKEDFIVVHEYNLKIMTSIPTSFFSWMSSPTTETIEEQEAQREEDYIVYTEERAKIEASKQATSEVESMNFSQECREAYFPSLTWRQ